MVWMGEFEQVNDISPLVLESNMTLNEIQEFLKDSLTLQKPALKITKNSAASFEVTGTIEAMQGKKKVDGLYFASVVPKPKDIRLYFFPIYTHADAFKNISPALRKMLKGKSCFHIKNLDEGLKIEITEMIQLGIKIFQKDGLI